MCLYPRLIDNRKYKKNKKNGGNVPFCADERFLKVPVGCGDCMECRKQKSNWWRVRLMEEIRYRRNGYFVTLTFSNESIKKVLYRLKKDVERMKLSKLPKGYELDNLIAHKAVKLFLDRWRKEQKKSVRHWLITELGHEGTENIHLHGIVWTDDKRLIDYYWQYGFVYLGYSLNDRTINYVVKYVTKVDPDHKFYKPRVFCSPGIGSNYFYRYDASLNLYDPRGTNELYKDRSGYKWALPMYYRNKIYDDDEREILWLEKLEQEKRFVDGREIDISKGLDEYYRTLEEVRRKNKRLGYGTGEIDWTRKKYEQSLREANLLKRINSLDINK